MGAVQQVVTWPIGVILIPPTFISRGIQGMFVGAAARISTQSADADTVAQMRERLRNLEDENPRLKETISSLQEQISAYRHLQEAGLKPQDSVTATVVGGGGIATQMIHLDKGTMDGVKIGDPVVAPVLRSAGGQTEPVTLLGRVVAAGTKDSQAKLFSDPTMKVHAQIIRLQVQTAPGQPPKPNVHITSEACLVEGRADNTMRVTTLNIRQPGMAPQKEDLICLADPGWPANTQDMVIGQIEEVAPRTDQPLRYDIRISPRISISLLRTVMIIKE